MPKIPEWSRYNPRGVPDGTESWQNDNNDDLEVAVIPSPDGDGWNFQVNDGHRNLETKTYPTKDDALDGAKDFMRGSSFNPQTVKVSKDDIVKAIEENFKYEGRGGKDVIRIPAGSAEVKASSMFHQRGNRFPPEMSNKPFIVNPIYFVEGEGAFNIPEYPDWSREAERMRDEMEDRWGDVDLDNPPEEFEEAVDESLKVDHGIFESGIKRHLKESILLPPEHGSAGGGISQWEAQVVYL